MLKKERCKRCGSKLPRGKPYCPSCGLNVFDVSGRHQAPAPRVHEDSDPIVRKRIMVTVVTAGVSLAFSILLTFMIWKLIGLI